MISFRDYLKFTKISYFTRNFVIVISREEALIPALEKNDDFGKKRKIRTKKLKKSENFQKRKRIPRAILQSLSLIWHNRFKTVAFPYLYKSISKLYIYIAIRYTKCVYYPIFFRHHRDVQFFSPVQFFVNTIEQIEENRNLIELLLYTFGPILVCHLKKCHSSPSPFLCFHPSFKGK